LYEKMFSRHTSNESSFTNLQKNHQDSKEILSQLFKICFNE
jgi:hypothetical protein